MATTTTTSVEEYLRTAYEAEREYVDGQLVERHVGERDHSLLQGLIIALLAARARERRFHVLPEQRLQVSAKPRYRVPDVCVMALPYRREPVLSQPPHLAIEIVSREDEPANLLAKVGDYLAFGIPHVWIVDPYKRLVVEADRQGIRDRSGLTVETDVVGRVDFSELFTCLDEPTE